MKFFGIVTCLSILLVPTLSLAETQPQPQPPSRALFAKFNSLIKHYPKLKDEPIEPNRSITDQACLEILSLLEKHLEVPGSTPTEKIDQLHNCIVHIDEAMGSYFKIEGESEKARIKLAREMLRLDPQDGQHYQFIYEMLESRASYEWGRGRFPEALALIQEGLKVLHSVEGELSLNPEYWLTSATYFQLQIVRHYPELADEFLKLQNRGIELAEKIKSPKEMDREFTVALGNRFKSNFLLLAEAKIPQKGVRLSAEKLGEIEKSNERMLRLVEKLNELF